MKCTKLADNRYGGDPVEDYEPFVCDECGRQATQADGTGWCVHCEREYQGGLNSYE